MAQTCVTSTLNTAAASCDSSVGCEFRGLADGPPVCGTAVPVPVALPFASPLLGRVLPLGRLGAVACSRLAVSGLLPRISLSSEHVARESSVFLREAFSALALAPGAHRGPPGTLHRLLKCLSSEGAGVPELL